MTLAIKKTTKEIQQLFKAQIDKKIDNYLNSCTHCGLCADACLFFTETSNPEYTPINKIKPLADIWHHEYTVAGRLKKIFNKKNIINKKKLSHWQHLIYDSCTMCARCTLACPASIDIVYIIRKTREAMVASGYAPKDMQDAAKRALTIGSPMGVTFKTLQAQIKHIEKELGFLLPIDKANVDYLVVFSSMEIVNFSEYISSIAKIFKHTKKSWTISSKAFEATNTGIQIGDSQIAKKLLNKIVNTAEKLKVNYVISPECGHAYTALRWDGPNLIGRQYKFKVLHITELLQQLQKQEELILQKTINDRVALHDPCQISRRGGVTQPQQLLNDISNNLITTDDNGVYNWCCGAGGGVSAIEDAKDLRLKVFNKKYSQIKDLNIKLLVSPCANCRIALEIGLEHFNNENIEVIGLTELVADSIVK